ncbi:metallo-beta-lactamase domain protein [Cordyceps militaris CM01]|uniref:Metallo-beta-lactamase domain protein n=1 Tax=Cordyceps militaris (strain CM01) TaxID=983644 RepID=G3JDV2_CORMM|nr:metallo-beta-lactamase domain protein [Cordyceps militaris CM01]EGX92777.1 metallo-beta-lactamase domain protein [Cordyceps militaris CM01]
MSNWPALGCFHLGIVAQLLLSSISQLQISALVFQFSTTDLAASLSSRSLKSRLANTLVTIAHHASASNEMFPSPWPMLAHHFRSRSPQSTSNGVESSQYTFRHLTALYLVPIYNQGSRFSATNSCPIVHHIFEKVTGTWQYIVADPATAAAAIIDPVLDYDPSTGELATKSADCLVAIVRENGYKVEHILETHIHADHVTAAAYLQHTLRDDHSHAPRIGIGSRIATVQKFFQNIYGIPHDEVQDAHQCLFEDDEVFHIGNLKVQAIHLPGHTPDHMGYKIGDNIFCGDSLFAADLGSSRCDFPGGSAKELYESGLKLLGFPDHVKIWSGHDYPTRIRSEPVPYQSVGEHKKSNKHLMGGVTQDEFIVMRESRDATLKEPRLLHQSLQINVRGGRLPNPSSGHRMIQIPITAVNGGW